VFIDKEDGSTRALAVTALEDKIVQRAMVEVLNAIYEVDFKGFSYGFRPERSQHDALDALATAIKRTKLAWIADLDVEKFFDRLNHDWLVRFLEHRIGDPRVIRLIRKWLEAGVMENGEWMSSEEGSPQGAVISPTLANVYLHYVFDLWVERWRRRSASGNVIVVRYADDIVCGFQHQAQARKFVSALHERLRAFALSLHPQKTRVIQFGRFAARDRKCAGLGKPETFKFLGFTHICSKHPDGSFQLRRETRRDRMRAKLAEVSTELRRRMHHAVKEQGEWLGRMMRGYFAYHAVPTNSHLLRAFRYHVLHLWRNTLRKRSQKDRTTWERLERLAAQWLPQPTVRHPWPEARFLVNNPRW
jgi:group II intron reverse transcriptase/maturase